jgi:hypothetical protein
MKVSICCGAEATEPLMLDYSICPDCKEHCEFEDYDSDDDQIYNGPRHEGGIRY